MIIHYKDDFRKYKVVFQRLLKYTDEFSFVPCKVTTDGRSEKGIFQTPYLFAPYGIQERGQKKTIDLSFMNRSNDKNLETFYSHLLNILNIVTHKFSHKYKINTFLKDTAFNECMRVKVASNLMIFDQMKQPIDTISSFSYGTFLLDLHGLWISNKEIWFQWYLVQAKIIEPICLQEYQFIDEWGQTSMETPKAVSSSSVSEVSESQVVPDKYDKMLKMGVPKEAVERQRALDMTMGVKTQKVKIPYGSAPVPPQPPPPPPCNSSESHPKKIEAKDLLSVKLKSSSERVVPDVKPVEENKEMGYFEPPSVGDIQSMLKRLKPVSK